MKVILIGAGGIIGSAVAKVLLEVGADVIAVTRTSEDIRVDISSEDSIRKLFTQTGPVDGIICTAGRAFGGPLEKIGADEAEISIKSKLMGQVNLVLIGKNYVNANGFITLTSGSLAEEPALNSAALGMVNGALNSFVVNAALEMPNGIRLNVVCPSALLESIIKYGLTSARGGIPAKEVAEFYRRTFSENITGQILKAYGKAAH